MMIKKTCEGHSTHCYIGLIGISINASWCAYRTSARFDFYVGVLSMSVNKPLQRSLSQCIQQTNLSHSSTSLLLEESLFPDTNGLIASVISTGNFNHVSLVRCATGFLSIYTSRWIPRILLVTRPQFRRRIRSFLSPEQRDDSRCECLLNSSQQ